MWCSNCQQDVPRIAFAGSEGGMKCARCGSRFGQEGSISSAESVDDDWELDNSSVGPRRAEWENEDLAVWDEQPAAELEREWEMQDDTQAARRLHLDLTGHLPLRDTTSACGSVESDRSHASIGPWHVTPTHPPNQSIPVAPMAKPSWVERLVYFSSWSAMCTGLTALACGGALMIWAYVSGRGEIWPVGMSIAVVGQVVLVIGLIMQVDHLGYSNSRHVSAFGANQQGSAYPPPHFALPARLDDADSRATLDEINGRLDVLTMTLNKGKD